MTMTPMPRSVVRARFRTPKTGSPIDFEVHFNPVSLQYTLSNTLQPPDGKKKQYVSQTSAKLTMDLVFDTTDSGQDVRGAAAPGPGQPAGTGQVAKLLEPEGPKGKQVPPLIEFSWGRFVFTGTVEQYKETLEYFSPEGVPLRASVNLTLASQDVQFDGPRNPSAGVDGDLATGEAVMVPAPPGPDGGPAGLSSALGDPRAARAVASANGSASLRFSDGPELALAAGGGGVALAGPAAFSAGASAGAGFGIGGGAGAGASFGIGGGASAGAGASFGASAGAGAAFGASAGAGAAFGASGGAGASFGASAGAGASASFGASGGAGASFGASAGARGGAAAFAGLRASAPPPPALPAAGALLSARAGATASASSGTVSSSVGVGGRALAQGGASLAADLGGGLDARAALRFDV